MAKGAALCRGSRSVLLIPPPEKLYRPLNALIQLDPCFPPENTLRLATIEVGQVDIPGTFWRLQNLRCIASDPCQGGIQFIDRSAFSSSDTKYIVITVSECKQTGPGHISHVYIVFLLFPVPINTYRLLLKEALRKDGYHTCLPIRVLAWPIHI